MPTRSRSKSDDHDDVKKNGVSGEKRKTDANRNVSGEFPIQVKRRREMIHGRSDRWNGDDGEDESEIVNIDDDDDDDDDDDYKSNDLVIAVGDLKSKSNDKHNEWPTKEEMRNVELEKELEKRTKRREGYSDKYIKHNDKVYKYSEKDNKHKGETNRKREDEYHKDSNRDYKHGEDRYQDRYWDDVEQDHKHKAGRAREDNGRKKRSRDHTSKSESKNLKDGRHRHTNNRGESPINDDRFVRHKDDKDVRRDDKNNKNKTEIRDYRSHNVQDQHLESKRHMNDAKIDPSSVHHRVSKQEETKFRDGVHEERAHHNFNSNKDLSDKVCIDGLSPKKRLKSDSQLSPSSTNKLPSHLPPQTPFKAGSDGLLGIGSSEHDRGKLNNQNWKWVDPNLGRTQTNWNYFLNWPYTPFHHVPPPMFTPFMYQSVPPIFGGPPMNLNHSTTPYHFTGDGYGNWDYGRTEMNDQPGKTNVVDVDLPSAVQQNVDSVHGHTDEIWFEQTGPRIENEDDDTLISHVSMAEKDDDTLISHVSMAEKDDDTLISRVYLSKIDVSKDLTRPEVYDLCTSLLVGLDQASLVSDECDCKILFLEEGVEDDISNGSSLFSAADDSIFKKAMSLYSKQKVHFTAMGSRSVENQEQVNIQVEHPVENQEKESYVPFVGDCKVKVKDSCNNDDCSGASLLGLTDVSTSDLIEFGSVNLSRIHSPETTH